MEVSLSSPMEIGLSPPKSEKIIDIIFENCIDRQIGQSETTTRKAIRITLNILSVGLGVCGAVPNIPLALKFGGSNQALGITVACCNFTKRTTLVTWAYHKIIEGEIGQYGIIKRKIRNIRLNIPSRITIKVAVFAIAFLAETYQGFIAYYYNSENILYPILTMVSLVAVPAYSSNLSLEKTLEMKKFSKFELALSKVKIEIKLRIKNCQSNLFKLTPDERKNMLLNLSLLTKKSRDTAVKTFVSTICSEKGLSPKSQTKCQKIKSFAIKIFSSITAITTTVAQLGVDFWVGVKGASYIYANPYFQYATGSFVAAANLYLYGKVMFQRSKMIYQHAFNNPKKLLTGDSIVGKVMPKTRGTMGAASIGISVLAVCTVAQTVKDYFAGSNDILISVLEIMGPLATFLLSYEAMSYLSDEICKLKIRYRHSTPDELNLLELDLTLETFKFIIEEMSPQNLAKLLLALPDDLVTNTTKNKITKKQLDRYIYGDRELSEEMQMDENESSPNEETYDLTSNSEKVKEKLPMSKQKEETEDESSTVTVYSSDTSESKEIVKEVV